MQKVIVRSKSFIVGRDDPKDISLTRNELIVLSALMADAKISDIEINSRLKISTQAVGKLRKKLEDKLISSYSLDLDLHAMGFNMLSVALLSVKSLDAKFFLNSKFHNVLFASRMVGQANLLVIQSFKSASSLNNFFDLVRAEKKADIVSLGVVPVEGINYFSQQNAVLDFLYSSKIKLPVFPIRKPSFSSFGSSDSLKDNELKVLSVLVENSRMSHVEISKKTKITSRGVGKIISRLEEKGIIKNYRTNIFLKSLGLPALVLCKYSSGEFVKSIPSSLLLSFNEIDSHNSLSELHVFSSLEAAASFAEGLSENLVSAQIIPSDNLLSFGLINLKL